jgi:hypothetical protein
MDPMTPFLDAARGPTAHAVISDPDLALLALIVRLAPTASQWTDAEVVARADYERQQSEGGPAFFNGSPPWCGLREPLEDLERAGLIEFALEAAEFHLPGDPSPIGGKTPFGIGVTEAGFAAIGEYRHYLFSIDEAGGEEMVSAGTVMRHGSGGSIPEGAGLASRESWPIFSTIRPQLK